MNNWPAVIITVVLTLGHCRGKHDHINVGYRIKLDFRCPDINRLCSVSESLDFVDAGPAPQFFGSGESEHVTRPMTGPDHIEYAILVDDRKIACKILALQIGRRGEDRISAVKDC